MDTTVRDWDKIGRRAVDASGAVLREAASEISQGLLVIDADLRIVFVNDPYRAFFGFPLDSHIVRDGAPLEPMLHVLAQGGEYGPGDSQTHVEARLSPVRERRIYKMDRQLKSGRHVQITGNPLASGGYVFTFTDVTHRVEEAKQLDEQVRLRTRELHAANDKLMDGIHYASMIQSGILPNANYFDGQLGAHFLYYRPADIVGGDFYLGLSTDYGFYVGLGDCTGHGVPGAMMTMLAVSVCRRAINEAGREGPAAALRAVDRIARTNLHQSAHERGPDNGLDLALCLLSPDRRSLRYAGAGIDLFVQAKGSLDRRRGTKRGLGYHSAMSNDGFEELCFTAEEAERVFLTSDGLLDQSGGDKGFGFGSRRMIDALESGTDLPLPDQGSRLIEALEDYRQGFPQRDDMAILGFSLAARGE